MRQRRSSNGKTKAIPARADGQIRQGQLVTTFGPGAMVDLVDRAVVIGGLDHWTWPGGKWTSLDDPRLRRSLLSRLHQLSPDLDLAKTDYFRKPPECDSRNASPSVGVRALEFPKWCVCQGCHRLARAGDQFEDHKGNEGCEEKLELLVQTASDAYFPQVVSALRLPTIEQSAVSRRVREPAVWKLIQKVKSAEQLAMLLELQEALAVTFQGFKPPEILAAIESHRNEASNSAERPLRTVEFERIVGAPDEQADSQPEPRQQFAAFRVPRRRLELPSGIRGLVVIPEMREIRVQVSFSRLDSISSNLQDEFDFERAAKKPAALMLPTGNQKWLPAAEVRGESIFLELDEEAWERRPAVVDRTKLLLEAYEAEGRGEFPCARFYMLHTLSHLLLTAISLECGYAASAIRERICSRVGTGNGEPAMAAVLLGTGTTGSEGTLGGLGEEGRYIRHHLSEAWDLGRLCSNDPVCAAHDPSRPSSDRRSEGAACHGCLYIAECSCEWHNRFLDRALVVPTIGNDPELAFFAVRP